ncbi:MAG: hypothetical protein EOP07_16490, partial [Proteobacteria bacterium]
MNMIIPQGDELLARLRLRKYGGGKYSVRYLSYLTGKYKCVSVRKSGVFTSKEAATEWARINLRDFLVKEFQTLERQNWRTNAKIVERFNEYSLWKIEEQPRSAKQDLSMLSNFGIPFFICELKEHNPNTWGEFGEELQTWLKKTAKTRKGETLAVSSANKIINSLNHFLKWMRRKKYIEYGNFRPFESFDQRKQNRRTEKDLVTEEVFLAIHKIISNQEGGKLFADMWWVQRKCGFRVSELLGLMFYWLSDECPDFIKEEFEPRGLKIYGSLYLESQPAKAYISRVDGTIERTALKWRDCISHENARTVPILEKETWKILVKRYGVQCELWDEKKFGPVKDAYLLFDGAQRNTYLERINQAYKQLGLKGGGSHVLRHSLSTEWGIMKINDKVKELVLGHKEDARKAYDHYAGKINAERAKAAPMKRF